MKISSVNATPRPRQRVWHISFTCERGHSHNWTYSIYLWHGHGYRVSRDNNTGSGSNRRGKDFGVFPTFKEAQAVAFNAANSKL